VAPEAGSPSAVEVPLVAAQRLALLRQRLAGSLPTRTNADELVAVARDLGFVQWDPVTVVAPSHLIAFWSRAGDVTPQLLDRVLWKDRRLFLHWMPIASLVPTEDYPIHGSLMRRYPDSLSSAWGAARDEARKFMLGHAALRRTVLTRLKGGPATVQDFAEHAKTRRPEIEWLPSSEVAQMLSHLHMRGEVMVVGHRGNQNLWGRTEDFLPPKTDHTVLSPEVLEERMAERAFRALGVASARDIKLYFVRGRYLQLAATLARLEQARRIQRVQVQGWSAREPTYVLVDELDRLHELEDHAPAARMSLIPPFDTLLGHQRRTKQLFGFDYVREQFLPPGRRRYGTYVLPIVWGDRIIGRTDPKLDTKTRTLQVHAVHAEPGAPMDRETGARVHETIATLAARVHAREVRYSSAVPDGWRSQLR
jgi:uncharacterized protein YcaQ